MITDEIARELKKTGIGVLGDVPSGTHFCYFYETKQDLLETLVLYFKEGLESKEFCVWVISQILSVEEAKHALGRAVPDLDRHLAEGTLEIHSHQEWYLRDGRWDSQRVLHSWAQKLNQSATYGYAGFRAAGDGGWIQNDNWMAFCEYERQVSAMLVDQRSVILCTYPLTTSSGDQVFDVAHIHDMAVARRHGSWEIIETSELKEAKAEIKKLNEELEQKVEKRTGELAATNEALRVEIAERKLAEEAVKRAENRIRRVIDTTPALIHTGRPDGYLDYFNQRWLKYVGLSLKEIEGWAWTSVIHPEDVEGMVNEWRAVIASGELYRYEARVRQAEGEYRWMLHHKVPLRDEQGDIVKWYGSSIDIEDRKRAEMESRVLIEAIPQQIWSGPPDGTIDYCSDRWRSYTGLELEDLRGYGWRIILHPDDRDRVLEAWYKSVANGTPYEQEERHRRADGMYRWFLARGVPLRDNEGRIIRWYGTNTDIEDRKRAEKEGEEANHQLRFLSRRLLHIQEEERRHLARELHDEVGQTLTAAMLNLKMIAPDVPAQIIRRLDDSIQLLDRLLGQVRELSLDLRPPLLDELGLVPTLRWLVDQQAQRAELRVTFTANMDGLEINPDVQTACFRVAQEAITNIIRHARAKNVAVEVRSESERLTLSVRDDGAGFDPAVVQQRTQDLTLGLVSMKERALLVRGGLEIQSAPGQGTEIRAWFPLPRGEPSSATETRSTPGHDQIH